MRFRNKSKQKKPKKSLNFGNFGTKRMEEWLRNFRFAKFRNGMQSAQKMWFGWCFMDNIDKTWVDEVREFVLSYKKSKRSDENMSL